MDARTMMVVGALATLLAAPVSASDEAWQRVAISPGEASVLREWASARGVTAGDGSQVNRGLVPTHVAAAPTPLRRGERLALDVYKTGRPLPPDVLARLPEQPRATMLMELDGHVIRVFRPTRTVIDVLN